MRKRRTPQATDKDVEFFANSPSGLDNVTITDRAYWSEPDPVEDVWIRAFEIADLQLDTDPVSQLLRSDKILSGTVRAFLADLLERHQLKRRRGGRSVPAYDRSAADAVLGLADEDARSKVSKGTSVADALAEVSRTYNIPINTLENFYKKKRGSTRRAERRRLRP